MGKLFGTDGVRGKANTEELSAELAFKLGQAAALLLKQSESEGTILIGKDTRISGDMLESALTAGICSAGMNVCLLGVVPTPAVSYLTRYYKATAGVVISASHNPAGDNGIKFFNNKGFKLSDDLEEKIEQQVLQEIDTPILPTDGGVGRACRLDNAGEIYLTELQKKISLDLSGLKIVVDCANGAASEITPKILKRLGAEVITLFAEPNGVNINDGCGSTHPEKLIQSVLQEKADLGLAHDGDADRLIAVDEKGYLVDGDRMLLILAKELKRNNRLNNNKIVLTVMSNLGLKKSLQEMGIGIEETGVGDRFVLERMVKSGCNLGGEQSGHIILLDDNTTGDGVMTALRLLEALVNSSQKMSELSAEMRSYPQLLVNVRVKNKTNWETNLKIKQIIRETETELGNEGRVLVRASGTEPLIRVMLEAGEEVKVRELCTRIADVVLAELG